MRHSNVWGSCWWGKSERKDFHRKRCIFGAFIGNFATNWHQHFEVFLATRQCVFHVHFALKFSKIFQIISVRAERNSPTKRVSILKLAKSATELAGKHFGWKWNGFSAWFDGLRLPPVWIFLFLAPRPSPRPITGGNWQQLALLLFGFSPTPFEYFIDYEVYKCVSVCQMCFPRFDFPHSLVLVFSWPSFLTSPSEMPAAVLRASFVLDIALKMHLKMCTFYTNIFLYLMFLIFRIYCEFTQECFGNGARKGKRWVEII